jgi:hypothetical protein
MDRTLGVRAKSSGSGISYVHGAPALVEVRPSSYAATDRTDSSRHFVLLNPYDPPTVWTNEHIKLITLRKGGKGAP